MKMQTAMWSRNYTTLLSCRLVVWAVARTNLILKI